MTRVALFSDVHGNLSALDTVLADIAAGEVDATVCLGDIAATGPQPQECVQRTRALGCPLVMGNTEAWLLNPHPIPDPDDFTRFYEQIDLWCAAQLGSEDHAFLQAAQPTVPVKLAKAQSLLCFHGSPRSYDDIILATTPDEELPELYGADVLHDGTLLLLAGGHTHQQMLRRYRDKILLNPGSVGLGYQREAKTGEPRNVPWAEYAIIDFDDGKLHVDLRRVPFDVEKTISAAQESGMPNAEEWISHWRSEEG